jgi:Family of unknown function (DUF6152)
MTFRIGLRPLGVVTLTVLIATVALTAQRPASATYNTERRIHLEGIVTRIEWVNPHAFVFVDVRDAGGVANWAVEIGNPIELERRRWKPGTLRIGDRVGIDAAPARDDVRQALARSIVHTSSGKRLFDAGAARGPATRRSPAPRWPDGQPRLGSPPGERGYWSAPNARALVQSSASAVPMNDDGLLTNLGDADRVAPFQPWAKALYLYRQRTRLKDDPLARCIPPGGPRQFLMPNGFQFVEQRELGRILVLMGGGNRNWRVIYTDGRPQGQPAEVVLTFYGTSVGHWEKDSLVVDSIGYNERFWFTNGGLPHTEALHLVERFSRPDSDTLKYQVTVDDPRTYTRPWSGGWEMRWIAGEDIEEYFCEDNAESTFVR